MGLGALIAELGVKQEIVTGHDPRLFVLDQYALISGLLASGCKVHDIGLALTPMGLFRPVRARCACVAMVTPSHNGQWLDRRQDGRQPPLTFGPDEMTRLKEIVSCRFQEQGRGSYQSTRTSGALHHRSHQQEPD